MIHKEAATAAALTGRQKEQQERTKICRDEIAKIIKKKERYIEEKIK